jgi:hypothetical protein
MLLEIGYGLESPPCAHLLLSRLRGRDHIDGGRDLWEVLR